VHRNGGDAPVSLAVVQEVADLGNTVLKMGWWLNS
jgi:hypothetical protein